MFCISLDFELSWGLDKTHIENGYLSNLLGAKEAARAIFELLEKYEVSATWATVGLLNVPYIELDKERTFLPKYTNNKIGPYNILEMRSKNEFDIYHDVEMIAIIESSPNQELASHTFSHLYNLEGDVNRDTVISDIELFDYYMPAVKTVVFPRNQVNIDFLGIYSEKYSIYRGCYPHWAYIEDNNKSLILLIKKVFRLVDSYLPITRQTVGINVIKKESSMINLPGTCFLRPIKVSSSITAHIRLRRIKHAMKKAAINNELFHLWWHPHNFGLNLQDNIEFLEEIILYYKLLEKQYGFKNFTMKDAVASLGFEL